MRAIAVEAVKGKPQLMMLPKPIPKVDQLLLKVSVAGMNPFDWQPTDGVMAGVMPNVLPGSRSRYRGPQRALARQDRNPHAIVPSSIGAAYCIARRPELTTVFLTLENYP